MTIGWCFDNSYSRLPEAFKEDIKPTKNDLLTANLYWNKWENK